MSNSTRRAFGRGTATVTVIDARLHRSSVRNARLAFYLTLLIIGLLAATVLADSWHPVIAFPAGFAIGTLAGVIVWTAVRSWVVIRALWWWLPELTLTTALFCGWVALSNATNLWWHLVIVALLVGVPATIPWVRRQLKALAWCVVVRHRLRVCFAQFIIVNRSGSLPLILWAHPTPVGERVWIYLRPGLSIRDLQSRLEKVAVACHAANVTVEAASESTAAFVRLDIKRREVLTGIADSPLPGLVDPSTPLAAQPALELPTALDLPDVRTELTTRTPSRGTPNPHATEPVPASVPSAADDDVNDWI